MAKMFYTLEEVCEKLDLGTDEVKEMVQSGQIQEFRDRDKLMFKVEQIDLLAGGEEDTGEVHLELEDTSGGSGLGLEDESSIGMTDSREGTGISVFDTDHGDQEGEQNIEIPANASGLFEAAGTEAGDQEHMEPAAMSVPMVVESYDGTGSGLGAGLMIGALAALICVAIVAIVGVTGATPGLAMKFASNLWAWFGGLLAVTAILGLVGLFIGRASE